MPMPTAPARPKKRRNRKPIQTRAETTRLAIIRAAAQVLSRRGYAGATTNHIAERAGVSIGTLYEYFRNKEQIVGAVLDEHLSQGEALLAARSASLPPDALSGPIEVILRFFVDGIVDFHKHDPQLHRVLSSEVPHTKSRSARITQLEERIIERMTLLFSLHPETSATDLTIVTRICVQIVDALTHRWIVDEAGTPLTPEQLSQQLVTLLAAYLRSCTSTGPTKHPNQRNRSAHRTPASQRSAARP
jgi:AcrR family transcriptional regulator